VRENCLEGRSLNARLNAHDPLGSLHMIARSRRFAFARSRHFSSLSRRLKKIAPTRMHIARCALYHPVVDTQTQPLSPPTHISTASGHKLGNRHVGNTPPPSTDPPSGGGGTPNPPDGSSGTNTTPLRAQITYSGVTTPATLDAQNSPVIGGALEVGLSKDLQSPVLSSTVPYPARTTSASDAGAQ